MHFCMSSNKQAFLSISLTLPLSRFVVQSGENSCKENFVTSMICHQEQHGAFHSDNSTQYRLQAGKGA